MIDKHEEAARDASARGRPGDLLPGAVLRPVLLPGPGVRVLRLHRADPRRADHPALPVRRQGAGDGDGAADVRDGAGRAVLQHRRRDRRRRHVPRQVPQATHPAGQGLLGEVLLHARDRRDTRSSTPQSARSASTSATTATSPRAGEHSVSTALRSCSTRPPRTAACPSTSGGSSSRPPPWPTCTTWGRSTGSASSRSARTTSTGRATSSIREGQFVGDVGDAFKPELIVRDLDLDKIREVRDGWQFYRDRRPDAYDELVVPADADDTDQERQGDLDDRGDRPGRPDRRRAHRRRRPAGPSSSPPSRVPSA